MGHINHLVINLLSSLTTDQADFTDDKNFYDVLASHVQTSSIETSLSGHIRSGKTAPIDPQTLAARWMIFPERACPRPISPIYVVGPCMLEKEKKK